jgi:hypothetical protein
MKEITNLLDPYDRRARLFPIVLVSLPALLLLPALSSSVAFLEYPNGLLAAAVLLAVCYLLTGFARSAGKRVQPQLISSWGGEPTTAMLRHRDSTLNPVTKNRYREVLSTMFGVHLPSEDEELAHPSRADLAYSSVVAMLRARRRGEPHGLVLVENAAYGFRRNLYGLRLPAIFLALLCAIIAGAVMWADVVGHSISAMWIVVTGSDRQLAAALIVDLLIAIAWVAVVRQGWVHESARDYATALLGTLDCASDT